MGERVQCSQIPNRRRGHLFRPHRTRGQLTYNLYLIAIFRTSLLQILLHVTIITLECSLHLWRFQRKTILLEWKGHVLLGKLRCTVDDIDRFSDDTANFSEENGAIRMRERVLLGKVRCTVDKVDLFGDGTAKFSEENGAISMRGRFLHGKNT